MTAPRRRVLVVDDEPSMRDVACMLLARDFDVSSAATVDEALRLLTVEIPDVLLTDLRMPSGSGVDLARRALAHLPDLAVIVMTGHGSLPSFVELLHEGVADFLCKPFTEDDLRRALTRSLETRRARAENARLRRTIDATDPLDDLVGESDAMRAVRDVVRKAAPTNAPVLVTGSSGTGKEVVARAVHRLSPRRAAPFVAVHCGALAAGLVESELFGHARGAFTGAHWARPGRFEEASGGTIFLDEIATTSEATQVRLLRVLQEGRVVRVGESTERPIDVRVVAATNADLAESVAAGRFRADLVFRLDVMPIHLPDLAQHREDVPLLASHFVARACTRMGRSARTLSQDAVRRLVSHAWPGNVRELENVVEAAVILLGEREIIEPGDLVLPAAPARGEFSIPLPEQGLDLATTLASVESALIRQAMARSGGSIAAAAALLRMSRQTLTRRVKGLQGG